MNSSSKEESVISYRLLAYDNDGKLIKKIYLDYIELIKFIVYNRSKLKYITIKKIIDYK